MTGRRLYDKYCDAVAATTSAWDFERGAVERTFAWPFLKATERRTWNEFARRVSPKPKPKAKL